MSAVDDYKAKAAQSALDLAEAKTEVDRARHRRAIGVWKRLIVNATAANARAAEEAAKPVKAGKGR